MDAERPFWVGAGSRHRRIGMSAILFRRREAVVPECPTFLPVGSARLEVRFREFDQDLQLARMRSQSCRFIAQFHTAVQILFATCKQFLNRDRCNRDNDKLAVAPILAREPLASARSHRLACERFRCCSTSLASPILAHDRLQFENAAKYHRRRFDRATDVAPATILVRDCCEY
mgnify:CR=1 FL=1